MNKKIILIAIIVIIAIIVGIFAFTSLPTHNDGKINTEITFLSQDTLKNGEAVQFILKDEKDNALANQNITITFVENDAAQNYSIVTDNEGKGSLVLNNENPGSYEVSVSYNGTLTYNGCSAKQTITIEEGTADASSQDTDSSSSEPVQSNSTAGTSLYNGNSSSSGQLYYDSQYNFYYDGNGIIRGGQNDGYSADYIRSTYESGNMIDEDGNLQ